MHGLKHLTESYSKIHTMDVFELMEMTIKEVILPTDSRTKSPARVFHQLLHKQPV